MDIVELIVRAGLLVKLVLAGLLLLSLLSWGIMLYKQYYLSRAARESAAFMEALEAGTPWPQLVAKAKELPASPLAGLILHVADLKDNLAAERVRSAVMRGVLEETQRLHAYLIVLATIGSSAPFIGLFGTVWGIINAFQGIGATGSASLAVVAPGIAEALVTTAVGLAAAIPAVAGYNHQSHQAGELAAALEPVAVELPAMRSHRGA